jgi:hypothetical protein
MSRCGSGRLGVMMILIPPFFPLPQHKLFGVLKGVELAVPLDQVAGLAAGDEVIHVPRAAARVGMNVINRQDHPVFKLVQPVEAAVLALEVVTPEDLHRLVPGNAGSRPGEKLFDLFEGHGSSFAEW